MSLVLLGLGSNVGDRQEQLKKAKAKISKYSKIIAISRIYETKPWGKTDQSNFLNQCLKVETELSPSKFLDTLKRTESKIGRIRREKWGPREIDIDILMYDQIIMNTTALTLPHAHLHERAFVLVPLVEIAPNFIHPILKQTISALAKKCDHNGIVALESK